MSEADRTVLHVLPHPGGGGDTYVDHLSRMAGYRVERAYLAEGPDLTGARVSIARRALAVQRAARRFDVVHVHGEVAGALCLLALALKPSVVSLHGLNLLRRLDGPQRRAGTMNLRLIVGAATRTVCVSETEHDELLGAAGRGAASRALVIRNGVALPQPVTPRQREGLRRELGFDGAAAVGAWIGSLDAHKDPLSPIRAVSRAREAGADVALILGGDGPLRADVERLAAMTDAVRVLGFRRDVERILQAADFFVVSSRREGLSFSLLEAMAHGLPPVVSDAPANLEAVGGAGVVVPYGDVGRMAAAFLRLAAEPAERGALGDRARERVARCFSLDQMLVRTRAVYDEVLRRRGRAGP